ncbi:MAG: TetR-like C-terminal domain-containing protein, partial [Actinomycetota bacterium]
SAMYRRAVAGVEELLGLSVAATPTTDERPAGAVIEVFRELARSYRAYCHAHPGRFQLIRAANSDPLAPDDATELREQLVATVVEFGRSSDRLVVEPYEHRVRSALAAIHGFILAELESFIGPEHGADRLFDELVVRCLVPYDLLDALDLD